jgi:REP element-mobilizing transposase RayT
MQYLEGHYYHIYNRGAYRKRIFFEDENYWFLIRQIKKYTEKYSISLVAFCLMPNHYHLLLKLNPSGNVGQCLRSMFTSYTQAMNKRYLLSGTLFQGQCKSKHIETDEHCKHLIRYIHRNPVEANMCANAKDWAYSDYSTWIANAGVGYLIRDAFFQKGEFYRQFVNIDRTIPMC